MIAIKKTKHFVRPIIMISKVLLPFFMLFFASGGTTQADNLAEKYQEAIALLGNDLKAVDSMSRELIEETKVKQNDTFLSKAYLLRGIFYYYKEKFRLSNYYYHQSLKTPNAKTDTQFLAQCRNNLAANYEKIEQYDSAYYYYTRSLKYKRHLGDSLAVANTLMNLATLETKLGNYAACDSFIRKSLPILREYNDTQSIGYSYQNLGFNHTEQNNHKKAIKYYKKALAIFNKVDYHYGIAEIYKNLALEYQYSNRYNIALKMLDSLKIYLKKHPNPSLGIEEKLIRINNLLILGELDKAQILLSQVQDQQKTMAKYGVLQNFYLQKMALLARRDSMEAHQKIKKRYSQREDSIRHARLEQNTAQIRVLHEVDKKNALLAKKDEIIAIKSSRNFWLTVALVIVLGLLVIVIGLYLKNQRLWNVVTNLNLARILAFQKAERKTATNNQVETDDSSTQLFRQIENLIKEHKWYQYKDLSVKMLAQELGTNELYISRAINTGSGLNFNNYINHYRVEVAKQLLIEKGDEVNAISEIGYDVGFSHPSAFSRTFKKMTGFSPSAFYNLKTLA